MGNHMGLSANFVYFSRNAPETFETTHVTFAWLWIKPGIKPTLPQLLSTLNQIMFHPWFMYFATVVYHTV